MERSQEKLERCQKNLRCIREVTDELLSHMKEHDWSFRQSVTDERENFSQEKLRSLVEELLSLWGARLEENTDIDPDTGESLAEPYLRDRRELYGLYLYLVMRCSLEKGAYSDACGGAEMKERTDFAFLLEQAKRLSREWCVMAGPDGTRRNGLYWGCDAHFGFHLYYALHGPDVLKGYVCPGNDRSLTPDWKRACDNDSQMTNEGNLKRLHLKHSGVRRGKAEPPEEPPGNKEEPETEELALPEEDDSAGDGYDGWDPLEEEDDWYFPFPSAEAYREFQAADWDWLSGEYERAQGLTLLAGRFRCPEEYCSACERFAELFETAKPEVLRDFYLALAPGKSWRAQRVLDAEEKIDALEELRRVNCRLRWNLTRGKSGRAFESGENQRIFAVFCPALTKSTDSKVCIGGNSFIWPYRCGSIAKRLDILETLY